jgi:urea transport system substrate-binding protein
MSDSAKNPPPSGPGRGSAPGIDEAAGRESGASAPGRDEQPGRGTSSGPGSSPGPSGSGGEPSWVRKVDPRIGQTFGKYRVEAVIGKGGMGLVYDGEDIILGRQVAIKFLPESLTENPKAIERFITEAQVAGRLNHPNIIAIYDIGQEGDNYYMVMELLNPISAANYIKERGPLHWTEATKVAADCCAALHAAHQVGLVHRDIKPDNILCSPAGNTKLVDFGLVKDLAYQASLTQTGVVAGTPLYMSPEQASDSPIDGRSDIYSLGATYFALLTGRPPYLGEAAPQIMFKHCTAPTPDPRELVAEIPQPCIDVLMRAMAKAPEDRFQSAEDMRQALEAALPESARRVYGFLVANDPSLHNIRSRLLPRGMSSMPSVNALASKSTGGMPSGQPASRQSMGNTPPSMTPPGSTPRGLAQLGSTPRGSPAVGNPSMRSGSGNSESPAENRSAHLQSRLSLLIGVVGLLAAICTLALVLWKVFPVGPPAGGAAGGGGTGQPLAGGPSPAVTPPPPPPIRVGVLNSLSGTMAISARPIVDATQLAIDELNAAGGLLGRKVEPLLVDGRSENDVFAREAERLITQEKVVTIFGGWTPSNRKAMKTVVEKYDHLLIFPSRDEGMEDSPNIIYNGATPNQQVLPAARWAIEKLARRRIFVIGSDGLLGHMSNELIKDALENTQARIVGDKFVLLSETNFTPIIKKILQLKPDVIFNLINGDSNLAFFRELRAAGVLPKDLPTISFSMGENELGQFSGINMGGDYLAWNYFESIDRKENREFVKRFKQKYGDHRGISDPMEAAYFGVHLWAQAVLAAGSDDVRAIRRSLVNQSYEAPGSLVHIDPSNNHTWKVFRLGKIVEGNRIEIEYTSDKPLAPEPFPSTRTRAQWEALLHHLYQLWGDSWVNPNRPDLLKPPSSHPR